MLVVLGVAAGQFYKAPSNAISIPGTDAQLAIDRANELFPDGGKGTGRIVFQVGDGQTIQDYKTQIDDLVKGVSDVEGVSAVASPFVSSDFISKSKKIGFAQVQLEDGLGSTDKATLDTVANLVDQSRVENLQIEIGGDLIDAAPGEILGVGEVVGLGVALLVLVMTLGSLIAAGMPIATALTAIGVSAAGLFALSEVVDISTTTPVLAIMLGLAVGIDYTLFIVNKYRTYARTGHSYKVAAELALATAGNAVIYAAMTVVIALAALSVVNIPFMTTMGLTGAASIAVAALVAISLTPALLSLAGHRVFSKKNREVVKIAQASKSKVTHAVDTKTVWYRWGQLLVKYPVVTLVAAIGIVGVIALPAKDLQLGLPTDQYAAKGSTERTAYEILEKGFGPGYNGPLAMVVEGLPEVSKKDEQLVRAKAMTEFQKQAKAGEAKQKAYFEAKAMRVNTLEQQYALQMEIAATQAKGEAQKQAALAKIEETVKQYAKYVQLQKIADEVAKQNNVASVQPALVKSNGSAGLIQIVPSSAPADQATTDLINSLRDTSTQDSLTEYKNVSFGVTGSTALQNDINAKLATALPQYLFVVVGLSLILLIVAFRSILVPIKATLGFLLSVFAMLGALVVVFQWGWFGVAEAPGPIVSFIPIIATGILFGLAMDYEFFLVSGMHEAYGKDKKKDARAAVLRGFGAGAKVVTAAGIIMVSVFAGFITNHDTTVQAIGFGLAVGILIDAFIVRMTIVPAVMTLLGRSAWWLPKWIDKRLPHVSIEGDANK